jgi:hypothetical protein
VTRDGAPREASLRSSPPRRPTRARPSVGAGLAFALTGCIAAIPAPVDPAMLPACSAGNYGVLGRDRCEDDDDCAACQVGEACTASATTCATPGTCAVACCHGRCTVVSSSSGL